MHFAFEDTPVELFKVPMQVVDALAGLEQSHGRTLHARDVEKYAIKVRKF